MPRTSLRGSDTAPWRSCWPLTGSGASGCGKVGSARSLWLRRRSRHKKGPANRSLSRAAHHRAVHTKSEIERDVVIVGGGPAGLSAALVLGRARQDVLVLDAGRPANRVARSIGGLLGHERSPASLRRAGRRQLRKLPNVEVAEAEVLDLERDGAGAAVTVACPDGVTRIRVRAVLLAT